MAKLLTDENFPMRVTALLRQMGHDVVTVQELGLAGVGTGDPIVLTTATALGRAVLTLDRWDFKRLHRHMPEHAGIVVCSRNDVVESLAARIDQALASEGPLAGRLLSVYRPTQRA